MQQPISAYHPANHSMATVSGSEQKKCYDSCIWEWNWFLSVFFLTLLLHKDGCMSARWLWPSSGCYALFSWHTPGWPPLISWPLTRFSLQQREQLVWQVGLFPTILNAEQVKQLMDIQLLNEVRIKGFTSFLNINCIIKIKARGTSAGTHDKSDTWELSSTIFQMLLIVFFFIQRQVCIS